MAPSTASLKSRSSSIKGGGRVDLPDDLQNAVIDLLRKRRSSKHPLLPSADPSTSSINNDNANISEHKLSSYRKSFVKKLVQSHQRHLMSLQFNQTSLRDDGDSTVPASTTSKKSDGSSGKSSKVSSAGKKIDGKKQSPRVRIELMEAIYKQPSKWKKGSTKKTVVLDRSTDIDSLLKMAKDKLKLKKKAVRCFFEEKKVEIDLETDLQGVKDGSILYMTSQPSTTQAENDESTANSNEEDEEIDVDPLDAVKTVYAARKRFQRQQDALGPPVVFEDHLANLPELPEERAQLPAAAYRTKVLQAMDKSRVVIICGATGCGKSTQIPQYIMEAMKTAKSRPRIWVTQPRRVAAMALATRVAEEQQSAPPGEKGSTVGYQVRLDAAITDTTQLTYMTAGILLRRLTSPTVDGTPPLSDVSHLVLDEVHERDITSDFCLAILRRVLVQNRHIKLVLMSATNTPKLFYNYFLSPRLGIDPQILEIPGRTFPIEYKYLADVEKMIQQRMKDDGSRSAEKASTNAPKEDNDQPQLSPRAMAPIDNSFITALVQHLANTSQRTPGAKNAMLIFLPGRGEIESLARTLRANDKETQMLDIHILHSSVPPKAQKAVFEPAAVGRIKVVLATNVAETSISIADVSVVIDTGRVKESRFHATARIKELVTVWVSQASATQRAGRAGRTGPGRCFRLFTKEFEQDWMLERTTPEILRTPLDELVLQACLLDEDRKDQQRLAVAKSSDDTKSPPPLAGTQPIDFLSKVPDPPPTQSLISACEHLLEIDAVEYVSGEDEKIRVKLTPLGYHLSQLPMDAKIGKILVVGSILGCVEPALTVAATCSSTKSFFWNKSRDEQKKLIESGFGGIGWEGGTVKGDCIASIAVFEQWRAIRSEHSRFMFAVEHGLDNNVLLDILNLRLQFRDCMLDAGFLSSRKMTRENVNSENASIVSCCLVAGLYPNVATLARPQPGKMGFRGGRLITKDGDSCTPSSSSFQAERVRNAKESGKDGYACYQSKNRILGTGNQRGKVFLDQVNFVSRFALILFGGHHEIRESALIVDGWLKFKFEDKNAAVLVTELQRELQTVLLHQMASSSTSNETQQNNDSDKDVIDIVIRLLAQE